MREEPILALQFSSSVLTPLGFFWVYDHGQGLLGSGSCSVAEPQRLDR